MLLFLQAKLTLLMSFLQLVICQCGTQWPCLSCNQVCMWCWCIYMWFSCYLMYPKCSGCHSNTAQVAHIVAICRPSCKVQVCCVVTSQLGCQHCARYGCKVNKYCCVPPAGKSFHSVQEVLSADKPRFSISGWYHKATPQEGSEHASLNQLQMKAGEDQIQEHAEFTGKTVGASRAITQQMLPATWTNFTWHTPHVHVCICIVCVIFMCVFCQIHVCSLSPCRRQYIW